MVRYPFVVSMAIEARRTRYNPRHEELSLARVDEACAQSRVPEAEGRIYVQMVRTGKPTPELAGDGESKSSSDKR